MHRITALCAAVCLVVSTAASVARPMPPSGYYVIRWDNTGICQIWNTELQQQPMRFLSDYKVVSKPVPTITEAAGVQEKMRLAHRCTM